MIRRIVETSQGMITNELENVFKYLRSGNTFEAFPKLVADNSRNKPRKQKTLNLRKFFAVYRISRLCVFCVSEVHMSDKYKHVHKRALAK